MSCGRLRARRQLYLSHHSLRPPDPHRALTQLKSGCFLILVEVMERIPEFHLLFFEWFCYFGFLRYRISAGIRCTYCNYRWINSRIISTAKKVSPTIQIKIIEGSLPLQIRAFSEKNSDIFNFQRTNLNRQRKIY